MNLLVSTIDDQYQAIETAPVGAKDQAGILAMHGPRALKIKDVEPSVGVVTSGTIQFTASTTAPHARIDKTVNRASIVMKFVNTDLLLALPLEKYLQLYVYFSYGYQAEICSKNLQIRPYSKYDRNLISLNADYRVSLHNLITGYIREDHMHEHMQPSEKLKFHFIAAGIYGMFLPRCAKNSLNQGDHYADNRMEKRGWGRRPDNDEWRKQAQPGIRFGHAQFI